MAKSTNVRVPASYGSVTNATAETTLGTITLNAHSVKVSQKIRIECMVKATSTNSTDTLAVKLKLGSTVLSTVAAADVANNDCEFICFTGFLDAPNELLHGVAFDGRTGAALANPEPTPDTAFDCQTDKVFTVTATWSVASADNIAVLKVFTLETTPV
jgi:hypothetical protein